MAALSDDQDLLIYEPDLVRWLPSNQADYTPQHNEARKFIIDKLCKDKVIDDESQLMDESELRLTSIYKALEMIFSFLSANEGDSFDDKSKEYRRKFGEEYHEVRMGLTVDTNDDGVVSDFEKKSTSQTRLERW